jgi:hypothetical protein
VVNIKTCEASQQFFACWQLLADLFTMAEHSEISEQQPLLAGTPTVGDDTQQSHDSNLDDASLPTDNRKVSILRARLKFIFPALAIGVSHSV